MKQITTKNAAIIAGIGLLLMAIIAPIANFAIIQKIIVPGDASTTISNIIASASAFRAGIVMFLIVALLDILVAWALYIFLKPVNKELSLLTAWLRIVYATLLMVAILNLISVLSVLNRPYALAGFSTTQVHSMAMLLLNRFNHVWEFGLIIFGFHVLLVGYLLLKAGYMKKILGILVLLSALGYLTDGFGRLIVANYSLRLTLYTFVGEIVLIFWLLIRGRKAAEKHT